MSALAAVLLEAVTSIPYSFSIFSVLSKLASAPMISCADTTLLDISPPIMADPIFPSPIKPIFMLFSFY